jgi:hypothetical protein
MDKSRLNTLLTFLLTGTGIKTHSGCSADSLP